MSRMAPAKNELIAILTGQLTPFRPNGEVSGILKTPVVGAVYVGKVGIVGDEQGSSNHGGPEKAIHHYALDHYAAWRAELPNRTHCLIGPGAFGENFSTMGMTEASVCIGDVYRVGTTLLQVSQGRQPCWKLNVRFDMSTMARRLQRTGRTGWYYRVLDCGKVQAGDELSLIERPNSKWPLGRLLHYLYVDKLNREALDQISRMPFLCESWRHLARQRLGRNAVENWTTRLNVPAPEA